jgi:proton glutamate symport protein
MTLAEPAKSQEVHSPLARIVELVPSNIFNALASGDTLKVLLFSILFGIAVGHVPQAVSASLADTLDTVYRACIVLTRWFNVLLPFASFAMIAEQVSNLGPQSLLVMLDYLRVMGVATLIFVTVSLITVSFATHMSIWRVFREHQNVFMMAIATRSSVACIPVMIELLSERLQFRRTVVELMVPLQTALLRAGPIMVYVIGTLFIAQLYGRELRPEELILLGLSSVLLGLTTAGMSGIVIISQMSILCGYFAIPFEAAFVLFIAVEAVSDTFRTLTLVSTITAATAAVSPLDPRSDPIEDLDFDLVSRPAE